MKICIIGSAGHWAYALPQLKHHTVIGIAPGFAGEDMSAVAASLAAEAIHTPVAADYRALLENGADIAIVNTRFDRNASITVECLQRDIFVFSEKPLALDEASLARIEAAQKTSRAFVCAMFGIRFEPWFLCIQEAVKNIGQITMINAQKSYKLGVRPDFYKKRATFGGLIPWVAIHAIDWIYSVSGPVFQSVSAVSTKTCNGEYDELETAALCIFQLENGAVASVNADYFRPLSAPTHDDDRLRIAGSEGVVEYREGKVLLIDKNGRQELPLPKEQNIFEQFLRRIGGENTGVTPEEGFAVTRLALAARRAADTGKKILL